MGQYNLNRIFKPHHVAVVGASEKAGTIGTALMRNLIDGGFSGTLLPVNPKYKTIHGHDSFESVSEKQGFKTVHGIVLRENRNMLALGKKLGFEIKRDPDSGDNELVIHFGGNRP